jgi:MFS family permease
MQSRRLWLAAVFLFVFGDALTLQTRGALLASFRTTFGVSEALLGLVAPAGTVGFVAAVLAVGLLTGRLNLARGLTLGVLLTAACLVVMSGAPVYWLFLLALVGQGTATGVVRGLDRPILSHLYPGQRGRVFALHALAWGLGAVAGPLLVNQVLAVGDWRLTYALLAAFFLPLAVVLWRLELPVDVSGERELSAAAFGRLLRSPSILGMAVAMILVGGIEGSIFTWLPYYGIDVVGRQRANLLLSTFLLAYIPGRLAYTWLAERVGYLDLVLVLSAGTFPSLYLLFSGLRGTALFAAVFVAGLFTSGFFPLISAFGVDIAPEYSGPVNAVATAGTYGGIAVGPVIVGLLIERFSVVTAMQLPVGLAGGLVGVLALTRVVHAAG